MGTNPSVPLVGVTTKDVPVQIVRKILVIAGAGFTYTVTVNALPELLTPEQVPNEGVTRYTAVCGKLVPLFKLPDIVVVKLPGTPPVTNKLETSGAPQV
jgi:hypothetical protein